MQYISLMDSCSLKSKSALLIYCRRSRQVIQVYHSSAVLECKFLGGARDLENFCSRRTGMLPFHVFNFQFWIMVLTIQEWKTSGPALDLANRVALNINWVFWRQHSPYLFSAQEILQKVREIWNEWCPLTGLCPELYTQCQLFDLHASSGGNFEHFRRKPA